MTWQGFKCNISTLNELKEYMELNSGAPILVDYYTGKGFKITEVKIGVWDWEWYRLCRDSRKLRMILSTLPDGWRDDPSFIMDLDVQIKLRKYMLKMIGLAVKTYKGMRTCNYATNYILINKRDEVR